MNVGYKITFVYMRYAELFGGVAQESLSVDERLGGLRAHQNGVVGGKEFEIREGVLVREVEAVKVFFRRFVHISVAEERNLPDCENERNRDYNKQNAENEFMVFL